MAGATARIDGGVPRAAEHLTGQEPGAVDAEEHAAEPPVRIASMSMP